MSNPPFRVVPASAQSLHGRGAADNPHNRFERLRAVEDAEFAEYERLRREDPDDDTGSDRPGPDTKFFSDPSRKLLATNKSPDLFFDTSLNPYRGCEHGCIYCYARPSHEYLGFSAGLDFESRILVKQDAPELLHKELSSRRWKPQPVAIGTVTDAYQPIERRLQITRRCLEVFAEFRNPLSIVTKSALVARDIDVLEKLVPFDAAHVNVSITTLDRKLHRIMEPRSSTPARRLAAIEALAQAGIPVAVMVAPIIPGINDSEIPAIVSAAARAGAQSAGRIVLRLPHGVAPLFTDWLERHFPDRAQKVLNRVRDMREGRLNDAHFHTRFRGTGLFNEQIQELFQLACRRAGLDTRAPTLSAESFRRPDGPQLSLFPAD